MEWKDFTMEGAQHVGKGERTEEDEDLRSSLQLFHSIDTISCR